MVSLLVLLLTTSCGSVDRVVIFPDPNLETAIRRAIEKPIGDIYESDLKDLTALYDEAGDITKLTGLEYCTSLTVLYLWRNFISDISPVASLTSLTELDLQRNNISDISPLFSLAMLT